MAGERLRRESPRRLERRGARRPRLHQVLVSHVVGGAARIATRLATAAPNNGYRRTAWVPQRGAANDALVERGVPWREYGLASMTGRPGAVASSVRPTGARIALGAQTCRRRTLAADIRLPAARAIHRSRSGRRSCPSRTDGLENGAPAAAESAEASTARASGPTAA
jgi:hypothetical protein